MQFSYEFTVLPNAFVVHQPHLPSFDMVRYRSLATYRKCLKALKGEFVRDLIREHGKNRKSNFPGYALNSDSVSKTT